MMKDRDQKQKALRLSVANRWFPQLEVDVHSDRSVEGRDLLATDLDVLSSIPDEFKGFRVVVFDCKTKAKESAVNRAFWLAGVLKRMGADQGFCVLKKERIAADHCLMADRLNVILLREDEFDLYASATSRHYGSAQGHSASIDLWEQLFAIPERFSSLREAVNFSRALYWMIDEPAERARKTLATLRKLHAEFDPAKIEHVALFLDYAALFARALAMVVNRLFKLYLQPQQQSTLSEALLLMLYGGRDAYDHRNEMFKLVTRKKSEMDEVPNLALPEWERFLTLVRQLLDAPVEVQRAPLILREVGFSVLAADSTRAFARTICSESPQGARFALLIADYLARASKLPPEFHQTSDGLLLPLQPTK